MAGHKVPLEKRFWKRIRKTDTCWLFGGSLTSSGYGRLSEMTEHGERSHRAHRVSWELHFGSIPEGLLVLHKCDVPQCVNPSHLFLGTHRDNAIDKTIKDRGGIDTPRDKVLAIRALRSEQKLSFARIAAICGVSTETARRIANCGSRRFIS